MSTAQRGPFSEIKIAVIGYIAVGKTTVLNALFRDQYSHVYMTPTTAAVSHFRISSKPHNKGKRKAGTMDEDDDDMVGEDITPPRNAESTLQEITVGNDALRNADTVQEKLFHIELQQDLCKMRPDTKLVFVDIPAADEAGASKKYCDYVTEKWHTFDCVIVVLDGTLGVNTEQMDLLKLVKKNITNIRHMPVIFLCNKVDEPEYEEPQVMVLAARQAIEKIFKVGCREKALKSILKKVADDDSRQRKNGNLFPVFIPISALRAFIYQAASLKSRDQFHTMDKDHILKLGKENVAGKKWRKLSDKEKLDKAFEVVSDPEQCREGLASSNFDKFRQVLAYSVGGAQTQLSIMEKHIEVATARLSPKVCLARELQIIMERSKVLGKPTNHLKQTFWNLFKDCETQAFEKFKGPVQVASLAAAMNQLTAYHDLVKEAGWKDEEVLIQQEMKKMIRRQLGVLFENAPALSYYVDNGTAWEILPPGGWEVIFRSILMVANERVCYEHFGQELFWIENFLRLTRNHLVVAVSCPECKGNSLSHQRGVFHCSKCGKYFNTKANEGNCGNCKYNSNDTRPMGTNYFTGGFGGHEYYGGSCANCKHHQSLGVLQVPFPEYLKVKFVNGRLEPVDPEAYKRNVGVEIPANGPSDPAHYGHLLWHFYRFMKAVHDVN